MITCYFEYVIDPLKLEDFEVYTKMWIPLVSKFGGKHHGYFLPHEGSNNKAYALFGFPSSRTYEKYRVNSLIDSDCNRAYEHAVKTKCMVSYNRSFLKPIFN